MSREDAVPVDFKQLGFVLRHSSLEPRRGSRSRQLTRKDREAARQALFAYGAADPALAQLGAAARAAVSNAEAVCGLATDAPGHARNVYEAHGALCDYVCATVTVTMRPHQTERGAAAYREVMEVLDAGLASCRSLLAGRPVYGAAALYAETAASMRMTVSRRNARLDAELQGKAPRTEPSGG